MPKKLVPVEILGATVWYKSENQIAFLAENTLIFKIEFSEQPDFKKFPLDDGACVWIYYIPINRKVSGVIPFDPTLTVDQLPQAMPVEVEIACKQARY